MIRKEKKVPFFPHSHTHTHTGCEDSEFVRRCSHQCFFRCLVSIGSPGPPICPLLVTSRRLPRPTRPPPNAAGVYSVRGVPPVFDSRLSVLSTSSAPPASPSTQSLLRCHPAGIGRHTALNIPEFVSEEARSLLEQVRVPRCSSLHGERHKHGLLPFLTSSLKISASPSCAAAPAQPAGETGSGRRGRGRHQVPPLFRHHQLGQITAARTIP